MSSLLAQKIAFPHRLGHSRHYDHAPVTSGLPL